MGPVRISKTTWICLIWHITIQTLVWMLHGLLQRLVMAKVLGTVWLLFLSPPRDVQPAQKVPISPPRKIFMISWRSTNSKQPKPAEKFIQLCMCSTSKLVKWKESKPMSSVLEQKNSSRQVKVLWFYYSGSLIVLIYRKDSRIRHMHEFQVLPNKSINYRRTSTSRHSDIFSFQ